MSDHTNEMEYDSELRRLDGRPVPTNACYYCGSMEGPFEPLGDVTDHGLKKCEESCDP